MARRTHGGIRVGIVDDDPMTLYVLHGIINGLSDRYGITVAWSVRDGETAVDMCVDGSSRPDVLLVDMGMDDVDGGMVCQRVRHFSDDMVIYGLTSHSLQRYSDTARQSGAQALLDKADAETLRHCLIGCASGGIYVQHGFETPSHAHQRLSARRARGVPGSLSPREVEVLDWTVEGLTAKEVADRMALSESTVKTHIRHAIAKLGVRNKFQLIHVWSQRRNTSPWHSDRA